MFLSFIIYIFFWFALYMYKPCRIAYFIVQNQRLFDAAKQGNMTEALAAFDKGANGNFCTEIVYGHVKSYARCSVSYINCFFSVS
jgi:hypothetical protein